MGGLEFENFNAARYSMMPIVYSEIMDCAVNTTYKIDWRSATLADFLGVDNRFLSNKMKALRFDFTKHISCKTGRNHSKLRIRSTLQNCFRRKQSLVCMPKSIIFPKADFWLSLVSISGEAVVVVFQDKWSREKSVTITDMKMLRNDLAGAIDITAGFGIPRDNIIAVGELWQKSAKVTVSNRPIDGGNIVIKTKEDMKKHYGPVLSSLLELSELMNRR